MSNLIKSVYFNVNNNNRVIDSDEKVENYIPNIYHQSKNEDNGIFQQFDMQSEQAMDGDVDAQEFENGISVISMEDVVNEEREKLQQELKEKQEEILNEAKQQAEEIVEQANQEAVAIHEAAKQEGYLQGIEEGRVSGSQELEQKHQELELQYSQKFSELEEQEKRLEPDFANLVIALVRKLTGIVCENKKDVILYLIGNSLKNLEKTKQITIRVSKKDMVNVSSRKTTFKAIAKNVEEFEIMEDNTLTENQCIIETDNKVIDCSLDAQLQNLEEHIKMLVY